MANNCYFEMCIAGKEDAVQEMIRMLKWKDEFKGDGLGRVFSFEADIANAEKGPNGLISVNAYGDCAWSIYSAMINNNSRSLDTESERLGLVIEAYSSEPGIGFQEHVVIDKGNFITNECVDYQEYWVDLNDEEYIQEIMEEQDISREELLNNLNVNGDYCVGGFENFGDFENLFLHFEPEKKAALDSMIKNAFERAGETAPEHNEPVPEFEKS